MSELLGELVKLQEAFNDLSAITNRPVITPQELAAQVFAQLLTRAGETVTEELARERANNIATALIGMRVLE